MHAQQLAGPEHASAAVLLSHTCLDGLQRGHPSTLDVQMHRWWPKGKKPPLLAIV